tara:strand:- start:6389 stop:7111 length:723 start_codon:yes stop_codon:yes gene_type:complete
LVEYNPQAIENLKRLAHAVTVRDVLDIDFPTKVFDIPRAADFSKESGKRVEMLNITMGKSGELISSAGDDPQAKTLNDLGFALARLEAATYVTERPQYLSESFKLRATKSNHTAGNYVHIDKSFYPNARIYLGRQEHSTLVVPHKKLLELIEADHHLRDVLDMELPYGEEENRTGQNERNSDKISEMFYQIGRKKNIRDELRASLTPLQDGSISLISGITFHERAEVESAKPFFRAYNLL